MRDESGSLTDFKNGDRFLYCEPLPNSIPCQQEVCGFYCSVYHHGRDNAHVCKSCQVMCVSHKSGDSDCPARAEEGDVIVFSGCQHPLSNHFITLIHAFGEPQQFISIEHAFFSKMSQDLELHHLADKIRNAEHAGIVKRLRKEMERSDKTQWEDNNMNIMRGLLLGKTRTCERFHQCLLTYKDKILSESTFSKCWGTGLNKCITQATRPKFWPGHNLLGVLLMDLTEWLISGQNEDTMDFEHNVLDKTSPASDEE